MNLRAASDPEEKSQIRYHANRLGQGGVHLGILGAEVSVAPLHVSVKIRKRWYFTHVTKLAWFVSKVLKRVGFSDLISRRAAALILGPAVRHGIWAEIADSNGVRFLMWKKGNVCWWKGKREMG